MVPVRSRRGLRVLGLLAIGLGVAVMGSGRADEDGSIAIRAVLDKQVVDWNRKDLDAFLEGYWHAPGVVFQSGSNRVDGFEAVRARYDKSYRALGKEMGRLTFSALEIVMLSADSALARGRFELTMSDGKKPSGLFTLVMRKLPEGWRIVHDHTSS